MGTYLVRRLLIMIPTLFGITIVSFGIMQLAPGDPAASRVGAGAVGQSTQNADVYLLRKRELHLDKPLLLNFNYFRDYTEKVHWAAHYEAQSLAQIRGRPASIGGCERKTRRTSANGRAAGFSAIARAFPNLLPVWLIPRNGNR